MIIPSAFKAVAGYAGDAYEHAGDAYAGDAYKHAGNAYAGDAYEHAGNAYAGDAYAGDAYAGDAYEHAGDGDEYASGGDGLEHLDTHTHTRIPDNTGPVDEDTVNVDGLAGAQESMESMETNPEAQSIETDDEDDDSDAEFVPASNGGLSQLPVPVRARPSRVARPPVRLTEFVHWVDDPREYLEEEDDTD